MSEKGIELILNELKTINEKISAIEKNMAKKEDTDRISEQVVANAENISAIDRKLEKLDSTIDLLSRRSIEQEAELKRIK